MSITFRSVLPAAACVAVLALGTTACTRKAKPVDADQPKESAPAESVETVTPETEAVPAPEGVETVTPDAGAVPAPDAAEAAVPKDHPAH